MPELPPLASIGLPVYNGDDYLEEALESLVKQTYSNKEIIISDNGSTDGTQEICEQFASKYPFVKYHRYNENRGVAWNRNNAFHLTRGHYFLWFSHDDVLHPEYLEKCIKELEARNDTTIVYSQIRVIGPSGEDLHYDESCLTDLDIDDVVERFKHCLNPQAYNQSTIYGVMEKATMLATPLHGDYIAADRCLVAQLSLLGKMHQIPEYLFYRRKHPANINSSLDDMAVYQPGVKVSYVYPEWKVISVQVRTALSYEGSINTKIALLKEVLKFFLRRRGTFRHEITSNIRKKLQIALSKLGLKQ